MQREVMDFDVLIVGAGPAGLAAGIKLKQLAREAGSDVSVCIIDKGAEVGAHIVSGAVVDPRALDELLPDWREKSSPLETRVQQDQFFFLSEKGSFRVPHVALPNCFKNDGNYIGSLGLLCRWLGQQAEELGIDVFAGFAAHAPIYGDDGQVCGVTTADLGVGSDGSPTAQFQAGVELRARYTLFAEGCRGHIGQALEKRYRLRNSDSPQVYGIGFKELWEIQPEKHRSGTVVHTAGWPLNKTTYGGSYLYHFGTNLVSVGFVVGLNYSNPYLSPYEEFQRYKTHPSIRTVLEGGKRLSYGARAITAGGLQGLPKFVFPGGCLIGDNAGFLNASRIKGTHAAMKSGMLAAESIYAAVQAGRSGDELADYPQRFRESWLYQELYKARNFKPLMSKGLYVGSLLFGIDQHVFRGKAPWTLRLKADHDALKMAKDSQEIGYPKPDGRITFDRLSSVYLSNTNHNEHQPSHLKLRDPELAIKVNYDLYDSPEQRYCPAGVYEVVSTAQNTPQLQINYQNCIHCKTCDIKDPRQNIEWTVPPGGQGPIYSNM
ncbi:electron transfer flavoprotein-ubiquinone oxidoreductase [Herbaspirillum sp. GCM10030257]|uniref:electron transfer flavoprotein-ubiquinone oxidoreductase n=1 Tax=Herbaspirillum sp. GCM10030257 TaxID=3273393 RepID=UPI00361D5014